MTQVVGVDGWKGGWVGVALRDSHFVHAADAASFRGILEAFAGAEVVAVDIPIGLPPPFPRLADAEAKRFLRPFGSRVFLTFPRAVYDAVTHSEATSLAVEHTGTGMSQQSWALGRKILEVDSISDERVHEVHPEVSFCELAGHPLPPKKTWVGQAARRSALASAGVVLPDELGETGRVPPDDVLDAAAAAWSARRIACSEANTLPVDPERGVPRIWY